jgi:Zn-finger nucleic acid-binding protein
MIKCPRCDVPLYTIQRQGVETDVCPECRGVWLDRGELDKIINRYEAFDQDEERANWREYSPPQKAKRRTFWSELFD